MESSVARTNSQRSQNNDTCNGPRVSFNKDVHVKRIGNRPNEVQHFAPNGPSSTGSYNQTPHLKRELPQDLSKEEILKEAAKVIAQAERIKCTVDTPNSIAGVRIKDKALEDKQFSSLPNRRKKSKPLNRSVSDASHKKPKRPSIFNIFSKRSDPNLNNSTNTSNNKSNNSTNNSNNNSNLNDKGNTIGDNGTNTNNGSKIQNTSVTQKARSGKPVGRSKSDVGYSSSGGPISKSKDPATSINLDRKRNNSAESDEPSTKSKKKAQLSPIIENPPQEKFFGFSPAEQNHLRSVRSEEKSSDQQLTNRSNGPSNNSRRHADDDLHLMSSTLPRQSKSFSPNYSKSLESLHSSQLPQEKLPLTKGLKVDGMVKRLSMERFSPPPQISSPAFSYTRPNEPIVYAQVVRDGNGENRSAPKQTVHSNVSPMASKTTVTINREGVRSSPLHTHGNFGVDAVDFHNGHRSPSLEHENVYRINDKIRGSPVRIQSPSRAIHINYSPQRNYSDEDEGLGHETRRNYGDEDLIPTRDTRQSSCEPPTMPKYRLSYGTPERNEHLIDLGNRRRLLESKINSRAAPKEIIHPIAYNKPSPGRQYLSPDDMPYPGERDLSPSRKQWSKQARHYPETKPGDDFGDSPRFKRNENVIKRHVLEENQRNKKLSESPNRVIDLGYIDQYRDNHDNQDYKPAKKHIERSPRRHYPDDAERFDNRNQFSTLEREKQKYRSFDKGDSGIENDFKRDREAIRHESTPRSRNVYNKAEADRQITALFLKRERQHTELMHPSKKQMNHMYRERSIDDGSHFDPRLDKYQAEPGGTLKRSPKKQGSEEKEKKFGTLKRMKELFLPSKKKQPENEEFMIPTDEMRQRYREHREHREHREPSPARPELKQITDIKTRRRLSTPKASPLPKRIPSQKSSKISHVSSHQSSEVSSSPGHKTGWFKSLERLSRKKNKAEKTPESDKWTSPSSMTSKSQTPASRQMTPSTPVSPPSKGNLRFFGDTDLESVDASVSRANTHTKTRKPLNQLSNSAQNLYHSPSKPMPKSNSRERLRSSSLQQLNNTPTRGHKVSGFRSKYLQDLSESSTENENNNTNKVSVTHNGTDTKHKQKRQYHSTEHLQQKSEVNQLSQNRLPAHRPLQNESSLDYRRTPSPFDRAMMHNGHTSTMRSEKRTMSRSREKVNRYPLRENLDRAPSTEPRQPIVGPTKPARIMDRHRAFSSERNPNSSGTEGESSQQSVVYLHATTVGHIPQPYVLNSRRSSKSREDLSSIKTGKSATPQPMVRTVSRSVSMLAPWTPKHIDEGYEVNYSQTMEKKKTSSSKKENLHKSRNAKEDANSSLVSAATLSKRNNANGSRTNTLSSRHKVKK